LNQSAFVGSKSLQSTSPQDVIHAIMGPTVCTQDWYAAVMFSPAVMGMEAWAGVPGKLQARDWLVVSKIGSLVIHFRWTM
jgi:hypothetical protein